MPAETNGAVSDGLVKEAREHFTYKGRPIPPFFLNDFAGGPGAPDFWKNGMGRRICAVSVEGFYEVAGRDASAYDMRATRNIGGFYAFDYYGDPVNKRDYGGYFGYRFLGTTPGGVTVLEYVIGSPGSAICTGVLLVRLETLQFADMGSSLQDKAHSKQQLVMRLIGEMGWGDRVSREVRLEEDRLVLGPATTTLPGYKNPVDPGRIISLD